MKLDPTASWGYPVLRSLIDDYIQCEFQSSIKLGLSEDFKSITLNYDISLSVKELRELIGGGLAKAVIYVYCRETWFGHLIDASSYQGEINLDKALIEGETEFWTLIISTSNIKNFRSAKFHPEYGDLTFDIDENQILGMADPESQYLSRDVLKNVSSLFDYSVNHNLSEGDWRVRLNENRLVIEANSYQVQCFRKGENSPEGKSALLNGVFLPAVAQAITSFEAAPDEFEDYQWARVFKAKFSELKNPHADALGKAQQFLRSPTTWLNKNMKWHEEESK